MLFCVYFSTCHKCILHSNRASPLLALVDFWANQIGPPPWRLLSWRFLIGQVPEARHCGSCASFAGSFCLETPDELTGVPPRTASSSRVMSSCILPAAEPCELPRVHMQRNTAAFPINSHSLHRVVWEVQSRPCPSLESVWWCLNSWAHTETGGFITIARAHSPYRSGLL